MFKVFSMYTPLTPYESEKDILADSLIKFNIPFIISEIKNTGNWTQNCKNSARLALQHLRTDPGCDYVYLDCDAVVMQYPELFDMMSDDNACHMAAHMVDYPWKRQLCAGTVFFKNCQDTMDMVKDWIALNGQNKEWDDDNLYKVWCMEKYKGLTTAILPQEYCWINDNDIQMAHRTPAMQPVILHRQVSRKYKGMINGK